MQELMDFTKLLETFFTSFITRAPKVFLILMASWGFVRFLAASVEKTTNKMLRKKSGDQRTKEQRLNTLSSIINKTAKISIYLTAGMMILNELGINIAPIIAGVGVLGLAIGFGAQSLVKDFVTGFFIILENQYGIGDVVTAGGVSGAVESINLRVTTLRDVEGVVHFIPNGQINLVSNKSKGWSRALLDVEVAYKENVDEVVNVIRQVCDEMKADEKIASIIIDDFEIPGIQGLNDSSVAIRVMVKTKPLEQWGLMREMRKRFKKRFDEVGIEIPFPQRKVWMCSDDKNTDVDKISS